MSKVQYEDFRMMIKEDELTFKELVDIYNDNRLEWTSYQCKLCKRELQEINKTNYKTRVDEECKKVEEGFYMARRIRKYTNVSWKLNGVIESQTFSDPKQVNYICNQLEKSGFKSM